MSRARQEALMWAVVAGFLAGLGLTGWALVVLADARTPGWVIAAVGGFLVVVLVRVTWDLLDRLTR